MSAAASQPNLRLVGLGDQLDRQAWSHHQQARLEVIKENRIAAHGSAAAIDPRDPRWRLAMQAQAQLEGPVLAPERRERLMNNARQLGIRPFEANLIIAIVQDKARQGRADSAYSDTMATTARLSLRDSATTRERVIAETAAPKRTGRSIALEWLRFMAALLASGFVAVALARWITQH